MRRLGEELLDRLIASDPGRHRLRLASSAALGLLIAAGSSLLFGASSVAVVIAGMNAVTANFIVKDVRRRDQAITLALMLVVGAVTGTLATLEQLPSVVLNAVFVALIFVAVYAQRFGPRGSALGPTAFFTFMMPVLLHAKTAGLTDVLLGLAVGLGVHALIRFVLWPHSRDSELLRTQFAMRYWIARAVAVCARMVEHGRSDQLTRQLERIWTRLHETGLVIEDMLDEASGGADAPADARASVTGLRESIVEIELAAERLSLTTAVAAGSQLPAPTARRLVDDLDRLGALIDHDPVRMPLISASPEFQGLTDVEPAEGESESVWRVRQALAELAVADATAQQHLLRSPMLVSDGKPDRRTEGRRTEDRRTEKGGTDDRRTTDDSADGTERTGIRAWFTWDSSNRLAVQALVGGGLAVVGGELLSPQRWYWAVLTVMVVFLGANSRGQLLVKGYHRVLGTLVGIGGGVLATVLAGGQLWVLFVLLLLCVFGVVYMAGLSQPLMAFFLTTGLGLMYSLLGMFSLGVLWLRLGETAIGAVAALIAAILVAPVRTRVVMLADLVDLLKRLKRYVEAANGLLSGEENVSLIAESREIDQLLDHLRTTVEPLTHRFSPFRQRRDGSWYVLTLLAEGAAWARRLAWESEPAELGPDDRLRVTARRIIRSLDRLIDRVEGTPTSEVSQWTEAEPPTNAPLEHNLKVRSLLGYLERMEVVVARLSRQFGVTEKAERSQRG